MMKVPKPDHDERGNGGLGNRLEQRRNRMGSLAQIRRPDDPDRQRDADDDGQEEASKTLVEGDKAVYP